MKAHMGVLTSRKPPPPWSTSLSSRTLTEGWDGRWELPTNLPFGSRSRHPLRSHSVTNERSQGVLVSGVPTPTSRSDRTGGGEGGKEQVEEVPLYGPFGDETPRTGSGQRPLGAASVTPREDTIGVWVLPVPLYYFPVLSTHSSKYLFPTSVSPDVWESRRLSVLGSRPADVGHARRVPVGGRRGRPGDTWVTSGVCPGPGRAKYRRDVPPTVVGVKGRLCGPRVSTTL